jgi:hypothetical protein
LGEIGRILVPLRRGRRTFCDRIFLWNKDLTSELKPKSFFPLIKDSERGKSLRHVLQFDFLFAGNKEMSSVQLKNAIN